MNNRLFDFARRHFGAIIISLMFFSLVVYSIMLPCAPKHWWDEICINEIARGGIVGKNTDWSMALFNLDGHVNCQSWAVFYLGGVASEIGYQLFGHAGPRIVAIFWLALSSYFLCFYLNRKTSDQNISLAVSFLYIVFPSFVQSFTGARMDVMSFAFLFGALSLLHVHAVSTRKKRMLLVGTGFLAITSVFVWITGVFLLPIILWDVIDTHAHDGKGDFPVPLCLLSVFIGGFLALVVWTLPFWWNIKDTMDIFWNVLSINTSDGGGRFLWRPLVGELFAIPGVYFIGLIIMLSNKRFVLLALSSFSILLLWGFTKVYLFRMVYFLPYALVAFALALSSWKSRKRAWILLGGMLFVSFSGSVLFRNVVEAGNYKYRNHHALECLMENEIGRGVSIFNGPSQLYYVGRSLEWRQFKIFGADSTPSSQILEKVDYYITEKEILDACVQRALSDEKFRFSKKIGDKVIPSSLLEKLTWKLHRFSGYGPFYLYKRID